VSEIVFAVSFTLATPLKSPHFGLFWARIREDFPRMEDQPPLPPLAPLTQPDRNLVANVEFMSMPPLRRVWFLDKEGRDIIQIQDDRFIFNWKQNANDDGYPGYDEIVRRFRVHFDEFLTFLEEEHLGEPKFTNLELIYVNVIDEKNGLERNSPSAILSDHVRDASRPRFLPEPIQYAWASTYPLPDGAGILHMAAQAQAQPASPPTLRIDLAARGLPVDPSEVGRQAWFDLAHEWATKGFVDVTLLDIQEGQWGREW
jgi:uncharacterized protein (TIGR04255 family)